MIFVTVGTTEFDGLIRAMDALSPRLGEPVVMQVGRGLVRPQHAAAWFDFAPSLEPYYRQASLVVSHGGFGTMVEVARAGRPLVGVSNPELYDHHQEDLLAHFEQAGHLVWCRSLGNLPDAIAAARSRTFAPYPEPPCEIHTAIARYLSTVTATAGESRFRGRNFQRARASYKD